MNRRRKYKLSDFEPVRVITVGSLGVVKLAIFIETKEVIALKAVSKFEIVARNKTEYLVREKSILSTIESPFIVKYFGRFQDNEHLYLVLEFLQGGDLKRLLAVQRNFEASQIRLYLAEIFSGLEHLHCRNIIYRGLKPENIMLDMQGHIRLVDFGMAKRLNDSERTYTISGTSSYLAPEILLKEGHGEEVDIWTAGAVLFEFFTGKVPFRCRSIHGLYEKILNEHPNFSKIPEKSAQHLCTLLLEKNWQNRPKIKEIKKHEFFREIDWREVKEKRLIPSFVPVITSQLDSSNFPFVEEIRKTQPFAEDVDIFPGF